MTHSLSLITLCITLMIGQASYAASRNEATTTPSDQQAISLSIYNNNLALIKDTRRLKLMRDVNMLAWRGVSAQMRPETAQLRSLSSPSGFVVQEQYFDLDLLSPERLLHAGGVVLKFADRIETSVPGRLAFASVPDNLRDTPTLVASLFNAPAGEHQLDLS